MLCTPELHFDVEFVCSASFWPRTVFDYFYLMVRLYLTSITHFWLKRIFLNRMRALSGDFWTTTTWTSLLLSEIGIHLGQQNPPWSTSAVTWHWSDINAPQKLHSPQGKYPQSQKRAAFPFIPLMKIDDFSICYWFFFVSFNEKSTMFVLGSIGEFWCVYSADFRRIWNSRRLPWWFFLFVRKVRQCIYR